MRRGDNGIESRVFSFLFSQRKESNQSINKDWFLTLELLIIEYKTGHYSMKHGGVVKIIFLSTRGGEWVGAGNQILIILIDLHYLSTRDGSLVVSVRSDKASAIPKGDRAVTLGYYKTHRAGRLEYWLNIKHIRHIISTLLWNEALIRMGAGGERETKWMRFHACCLE